jgi:hypothetical protein
MHGNCRVWRWCSYKWKVVCPSSKVPFIIDGWQPNFHCLCKVCSCRETLLWMMPRYCWKATFFKNRVPFTVDLMLSGRIQKNLSYGSWDTTAEWFVPQLQIPLLLLSGNQIDFTYMGSAKHNFSCSATKWKPRQRQKLFLPYVMCPPYLNNCNQTSCVKQGSVMKPDRQEDFSR